MDGVGLHLVPRARRKWRRPTVYVGVATVLVVGNLATMLRGVRWTSSATDLDVAVADAVPASAPAPTRRIPTRLIQSAAAEDQEPAWPAATAKTVALNAGFDRLFFDDAAALEFVRAEYAGTPLVAAYENAARPVMRADLFRLAAVAKLGGFWLDMDMVSKASLAPLADQADYGAAFPLEWWKDDAAFFARHRRKAMDADEHWQVGNYAFAAAPAHPLVTDALEEAVRRCEALEGSDAVSDLDVLRATGPYMLSEVYHAGRVDGRYADVLLLRGDDAPRTERPTKGGADWHKFGSFAEHGLAHSWVTPADASVAEDGAATYGDDGGTYGDGTYDAVLDDDDDDDDGSCGFFSFLGPAAPYFEWPCDFASHHWLLFAVGGVAALATCAACVLCCGACSGGGHPSQTAPVARPRPSSLPQEKGMTAAKMSARTSGRSGANF